MMVHQGFNSFSKCSLRFLSKGAQAFFILLSGVQFFLPYHWRWYYVILDNLSSCFMIHMLLRMRYLNPSISSLELSWVIFHLKPSLRIVAIYGAYKGPKSFFILPVIYFLVSLFISIQFFSREWQVVTS